MIFVIDAFYLQTAVDLGLTLTMDFLITIARQELEANLAEKLLKVQTPFYLSPRIVAVLYCCLKLFC